MSLSLRSAQRTNGPLLTLCSANRYCVFLSTEPSVSGAARALAAPQADAAVGHASVGHLARAGAFYFRVSVAVNDGNYDVVLMTPWFRRYCSLNKIKDSKVNVDID